jgi:hypothetical protein
MAPRSKNGSRFGDGLEPEDDIRPKARAAARRKATVKAASKRLDGFGAGLDDRQTSTALAAIQASPEVDLPLSKTRGRPRKTRGVMDDPDREAKDARHLHMMQTTPLPDGYKLIEIPALDIREVMLKLVSDTALLTHAWSEKAIKMLLGRQTQEASVGREPKNPVEDYQSSAYLIEARRPWENSIFGLPSIGFKKAAVAACTSLGKTITKVAARQAFHVMDSMVRIQGDKPHMRRDMVRVGTGTADIRFRAEWSRWEVELRIRYNARLLSERQLVNMYNMAGFAVGVFEWRPECDGMHGLFHVGNVSIPRKVSDGLGLAK